MSSEISSFYETLICRREKNKVSHLSKSVVIKFHEYYVKAKQEWARGIVMNLNQENLKQAIAEFLKASEMKWK